MDDIHIEALRRKAVAGDDTAICPLLLALGVDAARIDALFKRDDAFSNLVAARVHYCKRRALDIPKAQCVAEIKAQFKLTEDMAGYLADGKGYSAVREEARRQIKAEREVSHK